VQERRAHPRIPVGFGASVRHGETTVAAATRDMSLGGCLLESERPIAEGAEVAIALYVTVDGIREDLPPLHVAGQIRWTAEGEDDHGDRVYFSGVMFRELTGAQSRWLGDVIEQHGIA
jgi:hypothetical protein